MAMWTLDEGVALVRSLQTSAHASEWHVAIGGGVVNAGQSDKDLDLYLLPFNEKCSPRDAVVVVEQGIGAITPFGGDYADDATWHLKGRCEIGGKRVDVFIARTARTEGQPC